MVLGKLPAPGRPTILITVGQGPTALAVGAGGGCMDIFIFIYPFSPLSPSLWETPRYRLKYCLKEPLNPKQPTNHHRVITLCSIYIPPSSRLSPKDLDDLIPQLPSPFILLGDFDGQNILWGSKDINDKGRIIESFIDNHGLCFLTQKLPRIYTQPLAHILL